MEIDALVERFESEELMFSVRRRTVLCRELRRYLPRRLTEYVVGKENWYRDENRCGDRLDQPKSANVPSTISGTPTLWTTSFNFLS